MIHKLEGHKSYVTCVSFSEDNEFLASGSNDQTIIMWQLATIKEKNINIEASSVGQNRPSKHEMVVQLETSSLNKPLGAWSVDNVLEWLQTLSLSCYAQTFKENLVDGNELANLTNDSLLTNLHIGKCWFRLGTPCNEYICRTTWPSQ